MRGQLAFMREAGFDVVVVTSPGEQLEVAADREGVRAIGIPMEREISPLADLRSLTRLVRIFRRLRPDVVNAGTPKAGLLGMLAAKIAGVPLRIYTLRGLRAETTRSLKLWLLHATERAASACADVVICVSESLREEYLRRGLTARAKTRVIASGSSNGIDSSRFSVPSLTAKAAELRLALGIPDRARVIGFVGRLTRDKGVRELSAAFRQLEREFDDLWLLLVGDWETGDALDAAEVELLTSHPRVIKSGFVADTAKWYRLMDVLAFPSYREGFPNVPMEAGASGRPVVAFRATGTVDAVRDGVTGRLVPLGDSAALAGALRMYLNDPALAAEHGAAGRDRVLREFAPRRVWSELAAAYREWLNAARERRRR